MPYLTPDTELNPRPLKINAAWAPKTKALFMAPLPLWAG